MNSGDTDLFRLQVEELEADIGRYTSAAISLKKKLLRVKDLHRRVSKGIRFNEKKLVLCKVDAKHAHYRLYTVKQHLEEVDVLFQQRERDFQHKMFDLEDLKEGIRSQTKEVTDRISVMRESCRQLQISHQLSDAVCASTRLAAYGALRRWLLFQPVLKVWLASDSHTHDAIYAAANFEGIYEELCAHLEAKGGLEIFEDDNYAEYLSDAILDEACESTSPGFNAHENAVKSLKQENLARFLRSQNFDSIHSEMVGKLQRVVSSCVALRNEIIQREELRSTMNSYMMELSHALEEDLEAYLGRCEREATKSVSAAMKDLQAREVQPSTSLDNDRLANNTELNSISIIPKLFEFSRDKPFLHGPDRLSLEEKALAEHSLETSSAAELEQLKAFKTRAVAHIKSFNSWNYSKLYKWCKHNKKGSVEDIHGSVMKLFPILHGPVELIGQGQLKQVQLPKEAKSTRNSNRKSRRATTIGDSSSSNFDYMKKSMVEEAQRKISEIASKKSDVLYGPVAKTSQISLSDRETRINLQHSSRVVNELGRDSMKEDDDTSLETEESNARLEQEPTNSEPHQYRRHTSLNAYGQSADQSHHFRKGGKCFLYVTLLNLSAHSALSARQVLRTLQSVSAATAADSVSQISTVLTKALAESSAGSGANKSSERMSSVDGSSNRTIDALEDISTEEHVGIFTSTCDANFLKARGAVESWIGQNVGNGYETFKGALLDLLSSKQLDFATEGSPLDAAAAEQQGAMPDHQSSMKNQEGQLLSSDGFNSKVDKLSSLNSNPGRVTAADNEADLSRRILSTIENNINAFVSNNNDLFGEDEDRYPAETMDTTSLHRSDVDFRIVPSVAGSVTARKSTDSEAKSRKASTAEHVSKLVHGDSMLSHRASYHISSNSKKLHSMELALKGKLFTADFIWEQDHVQLGIVMRHYTNKLQFSEYQFSLTKAQIGDLAKVAVESVLQSLLNDTLKVLQAVMGSMSLERIDAFFHDYIVQMLAPVASSFSTQAKSHSIADATKTSARNTKFTTMEIDEMIQASNRNADKIASTQKLETPMHLSTDAADPTRQLDPVVLEVLILRRRKEGLMAYCFPQIHTSE